MWAVHALRVVLLAATLVGMISAIDLPLDGEQTATVYVTGVFDALKLQKPSVSGVDLQNQVKEAIETFDALPATKATASDGTGLGYVQKHTESLCVPSTPPRLRTQQSHSHGPNPKRGLLFTDTCCIARKSWAVAR